jgi:hypothetical protein
MFNGICDNRFAHACIHHVQRDSQLVTLWLLFVDMTRKANI